ncbi:hypothetical protein STENM327S_05140 [Streptomyces tendae]
MQPSLTVAQSGPGAAPGMLDGVRRWLAESGAEPTPARVAQALREQGRVLGDAEVLGAAQQLRSELVGSGPLEPLLADPSVTDVLVSAPDRVWVDRGSGLELAPVSFPDAGAVRRLAQRLATVAGRRLDDARPWVDARLPDGTRLHAVLPPVAVDCTCLSLRVVRPRAFTLGELTAAGTGAARRWPRAAARWPRRPAGRLLSRRCEPGAAARCGRAKLGPSTGRGDRAGARRPAEVRLGGEPVRPPGVRVGGPGLAGAVPLARLLERAEVSGLPAAGPAARLAAQARADWARTTTARARRAAVMVTAPVGLCFLPAFIAVGVLPVIIGLAGGVLGRGGGGG